MTEPAHLKNKKRPSTHTQTKCQTGKRMWLPPILTTLNSFAFRQHKLLEARIYPHFYTKFHLAHQALTTKKPDNKTQLSRALVRSQFFAMQLREFLGENFLLQL
jgi:hypothetical protein